MRPARILRWALIAALTAAAAAATATAANAESTPLPDIHTALPTDTYPIKLEGKAKQTVEGDLAFVNAVTKLPFESLSVLYEVKALTSLGQFSMTLTNVHENKKPEAKCNTAGDVTGIVLFTGEFDLVYTSLSPAKALELAALHLFPNPLVILCNEGTLTTEVEPPFLGRVSPNPAANGDDTNFDLAIHCTSPGVQEISSYFNDNLTELTGVLLKINISGTGSLNACLEVKPTILMTLPTGSTTHFSILY
jgi:hypothetical protein